MTIFTVVSSNPSNEGKTHVWKLAVNGEVTVFGQKKTVKRTFYIGGMPTEAKAGTELKEDIKKFEIVERPFTLEEGDNAGETIMLKWLHAKVAL